MALLRKEYTNVTTKISASVEETFEFFKKIENWKNWSSAVADSEALSSGDWREGYKISFSPKVGSSPVFPLKVAVITYKENELIRWGVETPVASMVHEFHFSPAGENECLVHHVEYSEGLLTLLVFPFGGKVSQFNDAFASHLVAAFSK